MAALEAAIDRVSTLVPATHVLLYSVIRQLSLPRAVVSCMKFFAVTVTVPTVVQSLGSVHFCGVARALARRCRIAEMTQLRT